METVTIPLAVFTILVRRLIDTLSSAPVPAASSAALLPVYPSYSILAMALLYVYRYLRKKNKNKTSRSSNNCRVAHGQATEENAICSQSGRSRQLAAILNIDKTNQPNISVKSSNNDQFKIKHSNQTNDVVLACSSLSANPKVSQCEEEREESKRKHSPRQNNDGPTQQPNTSFDDVDSEIVLDCSVSKNALQDSHNADNVLKDADDYELAALEQQMAQLLSEDFSRSAVSTEVPKPRKKHRRKEKRKIRQCNKRTAKRTVHKRKRRHHTSTKSHQKTKRTAYNKKPAKRSIQKRQRRKKGQTHAGISKFTVQELFDMHSTSGRLNLAQKQSRLATQRPVIRRRRKRTEKLHKAVQIKEDSSLPKLQQNTSKIGDSVAKVSATQTDNLHQDGIKTVYKNPKSFGDFENTSATCTACESSVVKNKDELSANVNNLSFGVQKCSNTAKQMKTRGRKRRNQVHTTPCMYYEGYATKKTRSGQIYGQ